MRVTVFSVQQHDREFLLPAFQAADMKPLLHAERLTAETVHLATGSDAVCVFTNDDLHRRVIDGLADHGVHVVALRCSGYDNLDIDRARERGVRVARVPAYSPNAIAEHAVALLMTLNRRVHLAWDRTRRGDFRLDHLTGFDLVGRSVGIVGTGRIGQAFARIMLGFGCRVAAHDPYPNAELQAAGVQYLELDALLAQSEVLSLSCPLTRENRHLINSDSLARLPRGAFLINTARGALVDTDAAEAALESGQLGGLAMDVYENEASLFFRDWSLAGLPDRRLARLMQRDDVLVTGHQAFLTREALTNIADHTVTNLQVLAANTEAAATLEGRVV
ncbi:MULTISPECIES: 2-hydroxyacid dehydrogenase [unclassified Thioalkalivibrio]|uniref:2-hydroxyacid dehydrogenase n=1 Tax=unclassified Thioalkalivibrio TaxID=2621013 RepID=UPI000378E19F|nr:MULTISPECIES: 2-hydroxyacid dehydrogenase [unclassified Thioalkalivibrio]